MRRVSVVGNSGSGKTTVAAQLAARLGVPHIELDAIRHQPNWEELPDDEFRSRVAALTEADGWVVDGNYGAVRDLVWSRADTVVWLDLPRLVVARRIVTRSVGRVLRRSELWNGNRETWRNLVTRDPNESAIRAVVAEPRPQPRALRRRVHDPTNAHLRFVRLTSTRAAKIWSRRGDSNP